MVGYKPLPKSIEELFGKRSSNETTLQCAKSTLLLSGICRDAVGYKPLPMRQMAVRSSVADTLQLNIISRRENVATNNTRRKIWKFQEDYFLP